MPFSLQHIPSDSKLTHLFRVEILEQLYPREEVVDLLSRAHRWEERERKLNQVMIVYYVIGLSLLRRLNLAAVFRWLVRGLRWLWPEPTLALPTAGALVYRRKQLGVTVLRLLFRRRCQPMATPETKGAFRFGLRLMALDSTLDEVADTPANALHFGRLTSGKSRSPFPQVRCLYLAEVGTHAIVDAVLAPCRVSEQRLAPTVLRSVQPDMLVLCDRNFPSIDFLAAIRLRQAHVLARVAVNHYRQVQQVLCDGSYLVTLHPHHQPPFQVRVIEYRLHPQLAQDLAQFPASRNCREGDPTQLHRLVTTLLDPVQAPALELIICYHERWEIENLIDELKTHQRLSAQPLRSQDPLLVYQELYGLLLAHYAVRWWMHQSAVQAELDPDQLSFTHALHVLETACYEFSVVARPELPLLQQRLLVDWREPSTLLPARRLRFYPRVVKRAFHPFQRKQLWHSGFSFKGFSFREILLI
jgi:Insertion element 4 transposase N-terminal/Transposase DDE domain